MSEPMYFREQGETLGKLEETSAETGAEVNDISKYRLFIKDLSTGLHFLIDTGANVSVLPALKTEKRKQEPTNHLYAANGSTIPSYGERSMVLNIGLRRPFRWNFVIAEVKRPILGADFLHKHKLTVDIHGRKLIDKQTTLSVGGNVTLATDCSVNTVDNQQPYHDLLAKYPDITRPNLKLCHSEVEHHIETTGRPLYAKARPLPPHKYKAAKEEFEAMLEQGICRPSNSPWASPLHLVLKKDGKYRACGDYRRLNAVTVPDRYPIPRLHDFTYNLLGKKFFSIIDLKKAYYQVRNREEDIAKTAVITPFGLFEFTRMCFGLRNAGQTFQRHIDNVLRGLPVFPFVDDILVASNTEEEHRKDLEEVFKRLRKSELQLNVAKCVFGQTTLDFLGYTISAEGIKPTDEKTKAITSYPLPDTIQQLRRFLGMMNFYRGNIPHAADHQKALNIYLHCSKKNDKTKIQWSETAIQAFNQCKEDIINAVLLSYPSSNAPFALMTDASDTCAGAVLQQKIRGKWKPIGFYSKKYNDAQKKYSTYDRELLSIYMAVQYFRRTVEGRDVTVFTDHKPLVNALKANSKNETPRRSRYLEYISQFITSIQHISGKDNIVADALSRVDAITCPSPINYDELAKAQAQDIELKEMMKSDRYVFKRIKVTGSTNKITCELSTGVARPFLPSAFRKQAFQATHELNHPGVRATKRLITTRYFWPSMKKDVTEWSRACHQCQIVKVHRHTKAPIASYAYVGRLAHLHIDIVGPLPISNSCRYLLTMIDRATKWPEAYPIENITAETVANVLYDNWIARFGCPDTITTDRGTQFESELFIKLMQRMGIQRIHTTAYHPQSNGLIERWHRTLKTSLAAKLNSINWTCELPTVLLGLRAAYKEDIGTSAAELLYGQTLRLPGEFYGEQPASKNNSPSHFLSHLSEAFKKAQVQRKSNAERAVFVHGDLNRCTHVYIRNDAVSKPLTPTYSGPFRVMSRNDKYFKVQLAKKTSNISIDRLKPAYYLNIEEEKEATPTYAYATRSGRIPKPPVRFAGGE